MTTLKEALKKKLSKKEFDALVTSYDIIGSIAIIEIPPELEKKEKIIGETLLELHKNIKTVLKKAGIHSGIYRRQKMKVISGKRTKVAEYKENNARIKIDVEKVYFSPRLSTERKRVYELVKPGEEILVMFSGCAPYPVVIGRNTKAKEIYGIELNPVAHNFGVENARINKLGNVVLINGDVKEEAKNLAAQGKKFDRILMPLPKDAESFLESTFILSKKGTEVHFYDFGREDEFDSIKEKIKKACKEHGKKCRILRAVKCGAYSPRVFRVCVDFRIL